MNKYFLLIFLLTFNLLARYWDTQYEVSLKKDELAKFNVFVPTGSKQFLFRWTLFINDGLVMISKLDGFPHHYILYKRHNPSFRLKLFGRQAFLMVEFIKFDTENNQATFRVMFKNIRGELIQEDDFW